MNNNTTTPTLTTNDSLDEVSFDLQEEENEELDLLLDEFSSSSFDDLKQRYSFEGLVKLIGEKRPNVYKNLVDQYIDRRYFFVTFFALPNTLGKINSENRNKVVQLIAEINTEEDTTNILTKLQQIDNNLTLPAGFQIQSYKPYAQTLWQANINIKKIITEITINEYLGDILMLVHLTDPQLQTIKTKMESISKEIAEAYKPEHVKNPVSADLINRTIELIAEFSRTPVFIKGLKEESNFGDITEIIIKLDFAMEVALHIRTKFPNQIPESQIIEEVKQYIFDDTNF